MKTSIKSWVRVWMIALTMSAIPMATMAASMPTRIVTCTGINCTVCDIASTAANIMNMLIYIAVFLAAIMFAYAGWLYLSASGGAGVSQGRQIFNQVFIGLVIILSAWLLVDTLMRVLLGSQFGPWNKIC